MARDIYPHDFLADSYYITAIGLWGRKGGKGPRHKEATRRWVKDLNQSAQAKHQRAYTDVGWEEDRVALLRGIEASDFFKKIRGDLVAPLYNQPEVWPKFGYEGSSAEHGG